MARPDRDTSRYRQLTNPFEPLRVLSADQVEEIHAAALTILSHSGILVRLAEARRLLDVAGATVNEGEMMVRFDPDMVEAALHTAPARFDIRARGKGRDVTLGGNHVVMTPVGGPPHVTDLEGGRRNGTIGDFSNFVRLSQHFDAIHTTSPCVEPQDVPINIRHLEMAKALLTLSDKTPFIYSRGRGQVSDSIEIVRIGMGVTMEQFMQRPYCWTVINTNSPRQLDVPMCLGIIQFAEMNQVSIITPFTLAGAMAPITLSGALALQHAEALAGITLSQVVRPGAAVVYGGFTSNVEMTSGAPAFGTPEAVKAAFASGQLARHIGVPWRSSAVNTANTPDAQAGYETMMNMMGAALGGANMIVHAAGWLESGLAASYEKFVLDAEMVQMYAELFAPLEVSAVEVGVDAIDLVDPGGHFFGGLTHWIATRMRSTDRLSFRGRTSSNGRRVARRALRSVRARFGGRSSTTSSHHPSTMESVQSSTTSWLAAQPKVGRLRSRKVSITVTTTPPGATTTPPGIARELFAPLAPTYERWARLLSMGQDARWRRAMVDGLGLGAGSRVLDVAAGTGSITRLMASRGIEVISVDLSRHMSAMAAQRGATAVLATAGRLPFLDATFDGVTFGYLLRYVDDVAQCLEELVRIVRPGGVVGMVEFGRPAGVWRPPWSMYTRALLPAAGAVIGSGWWEVGRFLGPSIDAFTDRHPPDRLAAEWRAAGMDGVSFRRMSLGGGLVMWGRRR